MKKGRRILRLTGVREEKKKNGKKKKNIYLF